AAQATTQAMGRVTAAEENTTIPAVSFTEQTTSRLSTGMVAAATNASKNHTTPSTQSTTAATTTTATTTGSGNQTTATKSPTTTATANTTTVHPGTRTSTPSTTTAASPTLAPQPSPIPTGTYTVSSGNKTCIKAVMGLQLMAQNPQKKQMEYLAVNPNATQTSGSCGTVQAELNITFSGGFINFTFIK
ncbi:LAMP3 protein, partial [Thinocorus orbignyianus]|nr:LAMP3 protein [Thinocorus orbignyianus]